MALQRNVKDAKFITTKAFPAAGASNSTTAFDLGTQSGYLAEGVGVQIVLPATPSLADAKTIICTVEDSADNITFAPVAEVGTLTVTGAGGLGQAGATRTVRLPATTRRYLRMTQAVLAAGGDSTALSSTFQLVF